MKERTKTTQLDLLRESRIHVRTITCSPSARLRTWPPTGHRCWATASVKFDISTLPTWATNTWLCIATSLGESIEGYVLWHRCSPSLTKTWPQSISARSTRNPLLASKLRAVFDAHRQHQPTDLAQFEYDMQNALTFMRSQRMYKVCGRRKISPGVTERDREWPVDIARTVQSLVRLDSGGAYQGNCSSGGIGYASDSQ